VPAVSEGRDNRRRAALAALAPGTALRDGLERILRGSTGALIVLGHDQAVEDLCSGGFELRVSFSATRLRELAKMDGAIVLDESAATIVRAAVQLVPDPAIPTDEAGTRHRTAERVARQTGHPVVSVSKSMRIIALYIDGDRCVLEDSAAILSHANQALATLERYRVRLDEVTGALSALEIEDLATVRDVTAVAQRLEMVRRIAAEIENYMVELGTDGRLLALQLNELIAGTAQDRELLAADYVQVPADERARTAAAVLTRLEHVPPDELLDSADPMRSTSWSAPGGTGCSRWSRGSRDARWTGSSSISAASRRSSPPASRTCSAWKVSADRTPGACGRACPGWRRRRSWSATANRSADPEHDLLADQPAVAGGGHVAPARRWRGCRGAARR
jgi:diadenylate cyclase